MNVPRAFLDADWRTPGLLDDFATWYLAEIKAGQLPVRTLYDNVNHVGASAGVVLFRSGPLQVQLFLTRPGTDIPDHTHPNVDSYEIYFGGPMYFRKDGLYTTAPRNTRPLGDGTSSAWGWNIQVPSTSSHGARVGKKAGAAFLSVQLWKNGILPSSVERDWEGEHYGDDHRITSGG